MTEFISEEEKERIAEFASIPRYQRTPEMLVPAEMSDDAALPETVDEE